MLGRDKIKALSKHIVRCLVPMLLLGFGLWTPSSVDAATEQHALDKSEKERVNQTVGYTITNEPSDMQISDKNVSYYYLATKKGQTFTVYINILNGSHKNTFDISANTGITNRNLAVDYGTPIPTTKRLTEIAPFTFEKIVGIDTNNFGSEKDSRTKVTVPANMRVRIPVTVHMPKKSYNGIMSGGISVLKENQQTKSKATLQNQYAYVKGLVLQQGDPAIQPELAYDHLNTVAKDYQPKTIVTINNTTLINVEHVTMTGTIKTKTGKTVAKVGVNNGEVSPATKIPVEFVWVKKDFKNGKYDLHLSFKDQARHQWVFDRQFTVNNQQAVLKAAKYHAPNNWLLVALIIIIVALIVIVVWLVMKSKKSKQQ